ncbi:MAG: FliH/SctL family protein [Pirellulales bacterium]
MSTVIKAGQRPAGAGVLAYNLDDVAQQGRQYLDKIQAQGAQILADARQQAAGILRAAVEQGRQAAHDAAHQQIDQKIGNQLQPVLPALREAVSQIEQSRQACVNHWQTQAVHVAAAIAARVIRRELSHDPTISLVLIREALELATGSAQIRLRLNPADHVALAGQVQQLIGELSRLGTAEVVADPAISSGGCRVETRFGVIDQQIEAQLARIEEELR